MTLHLARNQEATVWVGGLDTEVNEQLLWELMLQAGPLVTVHIPRDKITGEHSGYAFVEFASEEDADYAMKIMNMVRLFGKALKINKASRDRKDMDVGANVFVGNLDADVDDQLLYQTFSAFGQVLSAKVMLDEEKNSKGFGFVNFADFESSDAAIMAMSGQFLCYRPIHVSYAYKKEGEKGERHGSKAERVLAKKSAARYTKRPNMRFAAGPGADGGPPAVPQSAPPIQAPPPFQQPPPYMQQGAQQMPPPPIPSMGNPQAGGMPPPWNSQQGGAQGGAAPQQQPPQQPQRNEPPAPPQNFGMPRPPLPPPNFGQRPPPIPGMPPPFPGQPGAPPMQNFPPPGGMPQFQQPPPIPPSAQ